MGSLVSTDRTDSDAECIHGLGPVTACTVCNGKEAAARRARHTVDYSFPAKFTGRADCGHEVEAGEPLNRMLDGSLRCEECAHA